eukprot:CAMPEP_0175164052 /NCGR_PEP_ID=MMETSP0087-20121206/26155_1 /TAXON_ID=136419 /ORGANISM="Unknown Unknown, Strain D1" /LENGTH=111 /DNA_ID=CAMNT_0016452953 /DNA_START=248 /DNA_END=579 /DNA_ORIENTATION=+
MTVVVLLLLHACSFALLCGAQHTLGRWILSYDNYYEDGEFQWDKVLDMLLLGPIREEVVFRGVLFCYFYKRLGSKDPTSKLYCCFGCAAVFSLVHLINLFNHTHSNAYIAL